jgi:hypothetical protein
VSDNVPGRRLSAFMIIVIAAILPGCIPYAVGTTAQPVAPGETAPTSIFRAVPRGAEVLRDRHRVQLQAAPHAGRQARVTPYGGLRVSQVAPIARGAVHDSPTAGGCMGLRIGREDLGVSPEVGFYHDRSALELRSSDYIFVLSVDLHGQELIDALGTALSLGGR